MRDHIGASELTSLVEAEVGICDEMVHLAQREQHALARFRPAHLPELLAAQDDCAHRFARTHEALEASIGRAAEHVGIADAGSPSLDVSALLPYLPPDARERLEDLRSALEGRAYTLAVLNAQNALLVRTGLVQLGQTANVLADVLGESPAYGASGSVCLPTANHTLVLDRQA
ncbi:MAG TPA: flagellar protein FlgN [Chloroflexi bacterium]|jgi:hypothetical protein|nr:flagellar protein FlgN [Chloroflexota bacterium]